MPCTTSSTAASYRPAPGQIPDYDPEWLSEGAAEHAGYVVGARYGWIDLPFAWRRTLWWARRTDVPLEDLAPRRGIDELRVDVGYGQSAIAAMFLGHIAGEKALLHDYWKLLDQGVTWEAAFERAFGMTVDRPDDRPGPT